MEVEQSGRVLTKLMDLIESKVSQDQIQNVTNFIKQYFLSIAEDELADRDLEDLYGAVMSHWQSIQKRQKNEIKLEVFNPKLSVHGWSPNYTVVKITMHDMPFLVRSLVLALNRLEVNIHLIFHTGNLRVIRDNQGNLLELLAPEMAYRSDELNEAAILIEIDRQLEEDDTLAEIKDVILKTLTDVQYVVDDFEPMLARFGMLVNHLNNVPKSLPLAEQQELIDFLHWFLDDHFIFMASMEYDIQDARAIAIDNTKLGLMKKAHFAEEAGFLEDTPGAVRLLAPEFPLVISKAQARSRVNRGSHYDTLTIKHYDESGAITGMTRFVGLFTSTAYHTSPMRIPVLRQKVASVLKKSGFGARSHDGKALLHVLETFPRDELFQINIEELLDIAMGVLQLQERQRVRLFVHKDPYNRYVLCMVYVPRDIYNTELRLKMQHILLREFKGLGINFKPNFSKSSLCRIDYVVATNPLVTSETPQLKRIEQMLISAARDWSDDLRATLIESHGERQGLLMFNRYARAFPAGYREAFMPRVAVNDIRHIEECLRNNILSMCFYRLLEEADNRIRFKLFQRGKGLALTDVLPILENMGLRVIEERPYEIRLPEGGVWISDFGMQVGQGMVSLDAVSQRFQEAFAQVWIGQCENDNFNQLVIKAGLSWREIVLLRALAKYLLQLGFLYSLNHIADTLGEYETIAKAIVDLFFIRFDPVLAIENREQAAADVIKQIEEMLNLVSNLDQDRIIRRYLELVCAILRTNYFQPDQAGGAKPYISFKINTSRLPEVPKPIPMFEIFVYSTRVEGVHLRGAKVARGGIRWSDRKEDYRTEILGLVKAQQVKNAVIVPLGAKGGFICKRPPVEGGREAMLEEGIACYKMFISGLLDITDNIENDKIIAPKQVMRYDSDDPYLVVAADKGTATFSDIANSVAQTYGFWLGDAFASGGSNGYDHKKMGITARGAWESVKRHFFELGTNVQKDDFTVVGIGDMSGDVFGNGMLLSKHIRLVAAFNHMHIFVDPNPVATTSYAERQRLFNLPRSAWTDYDASLISAGGGVFDRKAKTIPLSEEMKKRFGLTGDRIEPNALIRAILTAEVDLLWNGGIGTYVKATTENNIEVGDRTNDALRVDAKSLRCRVVGEGGNLGFTQRARQEFALAGGYINTDAIDNSAGVDCSDHEVNIKILLNAAVNQGRITLEERNKLLSSMSQEVAELVLYNNYHQTQAISNVFTYGKKALDTYIQLVGDLEKAGHIVRSLEFIPSNKALRSRRASGQGFTAPEYSVLMAYTKTAIKKALLQSKLPDEPCFERYLEAEFPRVLSEKFGDLMRQHRLRREIIVTQLTNSLITYMGLTFIHRMHSDTGATPGMISRALEVCLQLFDVPKIWKEIEQLDGLIPGEEQRNLMDDVARLVRRCCRWLLKNHRAHIDVESMVEKFKPEVDRFLKIAPDCFDSRAKQLKRQRMNHYIRKGVPKKLADKVTDFPNMSPILDIVHCSQANQLQLAAVTETYYAINDALSISWLRSTLSVARDGSDYWVTLLGSSLRDSVDALQTKLVLSIHQTPSKAKSTLKAKIEHWKTLYAVLINRWMSMLRDLQAIEYDFIRLSVAIRVLEDIAEGTLEGGSAYANREHSSIFEAPVDTLG